MRRSSRTAGEHSYCCVASPPSVNDSASACCSVESGLEHQTWLHCCRRALMASLIVSESLSAAASVFTPVTGCHLVCSLIQRTILLLLPHVSASTLNSPQSQWYIAAPLTSAITVMWRPMIARMQENTLDSCANVHDLLRRP